MSLPNVPIVVNPGSESAISIAEGTFRWDEENQECPTLSKYIKMIMCII